MSEHDRVRFDVLRYFPGEIHVRLFLIRRTPFGNDTGFANQHIISGLKENATADALDFESRPILTLVLRIRRDQPKILFRTKNFERRKFW